MGKCSKCHLNPATTKKKNGVPTRTNSWCRLCMNKAAVEHRLRIKYLVFSHYSKGKPKCSCCGEAHFEFLTIDHVNGGGHAHRKSIKAGHQIYAWLRRNNFPKEFRVLCANCNMSHGLFGYCPHTTATKQPLNLLAWRTRKVLKGEGQASSKLTASAVKSIRLQLANGCSKTSIAHKYGVSRTLIRYVASGRNWSHV
jgi:hypothetical protein